MKGEERGRETRKREDRLRYRVEGQRYQYMEEKRRRERYFKVRKDNERRMTEIH